MSRALFSLSPTRYAQIALILLLIALDQISKISLQADLCENMGQQITGFFNLVCVWNHGISFGLGNAGENTAAYQPMLLILLTGTLTCAVSYWWLRSHRAVEQWGCALIIAGAIGNIMDRLRWQAVFDFLDFHIGGWHYPAFNLADSLICVGVGILLLSNLKNKEKSERL